MLVLDFKKSRPINFGSVLRPYLKRNYKDKGEDKEKEREKFESLEQDYILLDTLRKEATSLECSINSVKACYKYFLLFLPLPHFHFLIL